MGFGFRLGFWVFTICKPKGNSSQIMVDLSCGSLVSNKLEQLTISRRTETDESAQQQQHSSFPQHQNEYLKGWICAIQKFKDTIFAAHEPLAKAKKNGALASLNFLVLVHGFIKDESFQGGLRIQIYVRNRSVIQNLLQSSIEVLFGVIKFCSVKA